MQIRTAIIGGNSGRHGQLRGGGSTGEGLGMSGAAKNMAAVNDKQELIATAPVSPLAPVLGGEGRVRGRRPV